MSPVPADVARARRLHDAAARAHNEALLAARAEPSRANLRALRDAADRREAAEMELVSMRNVATGLYLELEHARREASRFAAALRVIRDGDGPAAGLAAEVLSGASAVRTVLEEASAAGGPR